MSDMQTLFEQVDQLTPDEIKELLEYIVDNHMMFVVKNSPDHVEVTMSEDFNDEAL